MQLKHTLLIIILLTCTQLNAQKQSLPDSLHQQVFALRYHSGFIYAQNIHIQNTKDLKPEGFEFEYSHLKTDSAINNFFKCYPRTGFAFTYVDFNSRLLGKTYGIKYFIEPNYRLGNNLKMSFRAAAGLAYLTNPHDAIKNPTNQSYSGHINNTLELNFGLAYPITKHLQIYSSGNFFHYSNGGFKEPNAGVNYINWSLGLQYFQSSTHLPVYKKIKDTSWRNQHLHFDVSAFYSPKNGYAKDSSITRKYVLGINMQVVKRLSNIDAITLGAEVYYDDGMSSVKKVFVKDNSSNTLAGLLIGHQFLLNKFTFSQQLGFYVLKQTKKYDNNYSDLYHTIYHRWGIIYNVKHKWSVGIMLLAHNQIADFIDGRFVYRLK